MGGGGKGGTSTSTVSIPPEVLARYNAVNARAEEAAKKPFQAYGGEFVAPLTDVQQQGISQTQQYSQAAQPYYTRAAGMTEDAVRSSQPLTAEQIQQYQNPHIQSVVDPTLKALQQQQAIDRNTQTAQAIRSGGFGGTGTERQRAMTAGQQELAQAQAISPLYADAYKNALATAQQQQQLRVGTGMQGAQQYAGIGTGAQQAGLQGAQATIGAGTLGQQTQQAFDTAKYQQFLQERGYDFQTAQFLANIAEGTGALSGSTTTNQQPTSFFSDERLKHDIKKIGKTNDGQPIYSFKYNGDDRTQIGLLAQEVEKKHPEAVGLSGGYKTVDYAKATAGSRTARAFGGLVPESMGGAVYEPGNYSRGGFAYGGDPEDLKAILAQQQKSFGPFSGGGLYGASAQQDPHGAAPGYVPKASLHVPKLTTSSYQPRQQQGEFQSALQGINAAGSTAETLGKGWDLAKRGAVGAAATKDTPASSGLMGYGGKYGATAPDANSGGTNIKIDETGTLRSAPEGTVRPADVYKGPQIKTEGIDEVIDPNLDLTAFSIPAAHGGGIMPRHGYSKGGNPYSLEPDFSGGYMGMVDEEPQSPTVLKGQQDAMRSGQLATKAPPNGGSNALGSASQIYSAGKAGKAGLEGAKSLFGADKIGTSTMLGANGAPVTSAAEIGPFLSQATPAVQAAAAAPIAEGAGAAAAGAGAAEAAGLGAAAAEGAGIMGTLGTAAGTIGESLLAILPFFSDARLKDNIKQVGKTFDGQNIYSYDMGDGRTQMGLLAQEVLHHKPEAVGKDQGYLTVDYRKATEDSAPHRASGGVVPRQAFGGNDPGGAVQPAPVDANGVPGPKDVYNHLISQGADPNTALMLTGAAASESNFNPTAPHDYDQNGVPAGYGMFGHQGPRLAAMRQATGAEKPNWKQQATFALTEAQDPRYRDLLANAKTPEDFARVQMHFERPKGYTPDKPEAGHNWSGRVAHIAALQPLTAGQDVNWPTGAPKQQPQQAYPFQQQIEGGFGKAKAMADSLAPTDYQGKERKGGMGEFLTSKDFVIPLLTGLGTMASSPSRYLGAAILQGLGGGAQAYANLQKQQADIGQTLATTGQTGMQTEGLRQDMVTGSFKVQSDGRATVTYRAPDGSIKLMYAAEFFALPADKRPRLDPVSEKESQEYARAKGLVTTPAPAPAPTAGGLGAGKDVVAPPSGAVTTPPPAGEVTPPPPAGGPSETPQIPGVVVNPDHLNQIQERAKTLENQGNAVISAQPRAKAYDEQAALATAAQAQRPQMMSFAGALAALPRGQSALTSGKQQEVLQPLVAVLNGLAGTVGLPNFVNAQALANSEEVKKSVNLMAQQAAKGGNQASYSALSEIMSSIPSNLNSPEAQAKLLADILTVQQREIDKDKYFALVRKQAEGPNGIYSRGVLGTGADAERAFNDSNAAKIAQEKQQLTRMFNEQAKGHTENGRPVSVMEYLAKNAGTLSEKQRAAIENNYGKGILRYFGAGN